MRYALASSIWVRFPKAGLITLQQRFNHLLFDTQKQITIGSGGLSEYLTLHMIGQKPVKKNLGRRKAVCSTAYLVMIQPP